ncbi:MAG: DUF4169 family protein [Paracoccaceae bacterium]|nr:DUF4169 family protein [Paracoccaceae bacterium]
MAQVISFNKVKKAATKRAAHTKADENSQKFGRSQLQKKLEAAQLDNAKIYLDGHKKT